MSDFWSQPKTVKARKAHKCADCFGEIRVGEEYSRGFGIYDGHAYAWKECLHCRAMLKRIDWDDTYGPEDFIDFEPSDLEELRVKVHYRKQWRRPDGTHYPIPFQEKATL